MSRVLNAVKRHGAWVVTSVLLPVVASAAPVAALDVTDATGSLTNQIAPMTSILTTILGLVALVMAFGWIRRTMK